jgi:hypothetical protein
MTNDPSIRRVVSQIVKEWVEEGKMFTAFEISLAAKDRGVRERHRNMKNMVHEVIFEYGEPLGYTRTLRDVGAPEQAWVYHQPGDNPYRYRPLPRHDAPGADVDLDATPDVTLVIPNGIRNPIRLATGVKVPSSIPPGAFGTDQRGRLCVPVVLLAQMGARPGQGVHVQCNRTDETVSLTRPNATDPQDPDATYTVEADGNVRITQMTLEKAGIDHLQCYKIEGNASLITVSKYEWE